MKKITSIIITIIICLVSNATVYKPFEQIDNSLPSDKTWNKISNETHPQYEFNESNINTFANATIGGGRVYFCPQCGAALHPDDHTELDKKQNGNAYKYTGRIHHCLLPLNGEYIFIILIMILLFSKILFVNKDKVKNE